MALLKTKQIDGTFVPEWLVDLFGRLRVSLPSIISSVNQSSSIYQTFSNAGQVSGTNGVATFSENSSSTNLTVAANVSLVRLRASTPGLYQPGKPLLIYITAVFGTATAGVNKKVGYMFGNDGIYLEQRGTSGLFWCILSGVTGSPVLTQSISKANWNVDRFDGTQVGYNLNVANAQLMFIALGWLGVGDVAVGFVQNGTPVVAHVFDHANNLTLPYISTANLFLNWEIERLSGTGTSALRAICGSVMVEVTNDRISTGFSVRRTESYSTAGANTWRAVILFRLNPAQINSLVELVSISLNFPSTAAANLVSIIRNPALNPAYTPTWVPRANTAIDIDTVVTNSQAITNWETNCVWTGSITSATNFREQPRFDEGFCFMTSSFNGTPDIYALAIQSNVANLTILGAVMNFRQYG